MDDPTDRPLNHDEERRRIQRGRNIALGLLLGGLVILFYFITIAKISG